MPPSLALECRAGALVPFMALNARAWQHLRFDSVVTPALFPHGTCVSAKYLSAGRRGGSPAHGSLAVDVGATVLERNQRSVQRPREFGLWSDCGLGGVCVEGRLWLRIQKSMAVSGKEPQYIRCVMPVMTVAILAPRASGPAGLYFSAEYFSYFTRILYMIRIFRYFIIKYPVFSNNASVTRTGVNLGAGEPRCRRFQSETLLARLF